jgi:ankyrin repeat protein
MIQALLTNFTASPSNFLKELFKKDIDENLLQKMLNTKKFSINYQNEKGESFLHLCILHNKFKSARWLIERGGIDPNLEDISKNKPIDLAIKKNNHLIVELLLKSNLIDPNQLDQDGRSLLQNAVINGNYEIAMELIKNAADVNSTDNNGRNVMFDAISYGDDRIIDKLLNETKIDLNQQDKDLQTVLHKKEVFLNDNLCNKLLFKGANPTICDKKEENLLYHAAMRGIDGKNILDTAIKYGCNINTKVRNNNSILMETLLAFYKIPPREKERRESLLKMAEELLHKGIDINTINNDGENGLFEAIRNNDFQICAFFINANINLNLQNIHGETPLFHAVMSGIQKLDIILLLLKTGANPTLKNSLGKDILEILNDLILYIHNKKELENELLIKYAHKENHYMAVLKEVLHNSNYNLQNHTSDGEPLFFAPLLCGDFDLFKLYMMYKFKINTLDKNNLNIFYLYVFNIFQINRYQENFKSILNLMMSYKIDIDVKDKDGKTIISKIIQNNTNIKLFETLLESVRFRLDSKDNLGRTLCHQAVLSKNLEIVKLVFQKENNVINIADNYGILPIIYATLLGHFEIVQELLRYSTTFIKSSQKIQLEVRCKFAPMVAKVDELKLQTTNGDLLRKIGILIDQIKMDFSTHIDE